MHFQNDLCSIYILMKNFFYIYLYAGMCDVCWLCTATHKPLINKKIVTHKIVLRLVSVNIVHNSVEKLFMFSAVFLNNGQTRYLGMTNI
jgi:hypothetical protein